MKETAHLRITARKAKELYLSGLFTTHAYLYILVRALRKDGWWLYFNSVPEFCQEWGISERSFYRAKAILVSQGYLEETIQGKFGLRCPAEEEETEDTATSGRGLQEVAEDCNKWQDKSGRGLQQVAGTLQKVAGTLQQVAEGTATSGRTTPPKPAPHKDSTDPTDLDQIYTTYTHREKDSLNTNNQVMDLDMENTGTWDPMDLGDPTRDPGSDLMMDPDPTGDPGSKFTQPALSQLHREVPGGSGSNSMGTNGWDPSLSSRMRIGEFLAETKRKLMEQVQRQRSEREQRWQRTNVLPVGTRGSSLTPGLSDPDTTTTSTFRSSVRPVMQRLGYGTRSEG